MAGRCANPRQSLSCSYETRNPPCLATLHIIHRTNSVTSEAQEPEGAMMVSEEEQVAAAREPKPPLGDGRSIAG